MEIVTRIEDLRQRKEILTLQQAADIIKAHPVTVREWIRTKGLPAIRLGNKWRVDSGGLAKWLLKHTV